MKTVILAGGLGTRLGEETSVRPKPMVEIGGMPIIWHIMKMYSQAGLNDFVVCLGYKGFLIKEYFANYVLHTSDVTVDLAANAIEVHSSRSEPWRITLVDTGPDSMTGGRLGAIRSYLNPGEPFCFTYGDGVSNLDIEDLVQFHLRHGRRATVTAVAPPSRFGALEIENGYVTSFREKPLAGGGRINGGFFVGDPSILDLIKGPQTVWEAEPMEQLATDGDLVAYAHDGFWQPMDTLRDKLFLDELWRKGQAPWKTW